MLPEPFLCHCSISLNSIQISLQSIYKGIITGSKTLFKFHPTTSQKGYVNRRFSMLINASSFPVENWILSLFFFYFLKNLFLMMITWYIRVGMIKD